MYTTFYVRTRIEELGDVKPPPRSIYKPTIDTFQRYPFIATVKFPQKFLKSHRDPDHHQANQLLQVAHPTQLQKFVNNVWSYPLHKHKHKGTNKTLSTEVILQVYITRRILRKTEVLQVISRLTTSNVRAT